jgi:hypothetical protein
MKDWIAAHPGRAKEAMAHVLVSCIWSLAVLLTSTASYLLWTLDGSPVERCPRKSQSRKTIQVQAQARYRFTGSWPKHERPTYL